MTDQHPITPPDELRMLWAQQAQRIHPCDPVAWMLHVSTAASQWGWDQRGAANEAELQQRADQELEACCEWLAQEGYIAIPPRLRAARRPKPLSKADQAIADLGALVADLSKHGMAFKATNLRRALERLKELEAAE